MLIERLQRYMRIAGYSPRTIAAYVRCARILYQHYQKPLSAVTEAEFSEFLDRLARKRMSPYTLNQYHAALKLIVTRIYRKPWRYRFPYAKRHKKLPVVLTRQEISRLLKHTRNRKHR